MTAGGALITSHLVKGPLRFSPHPFGARLQAGCAPRAASGLTPDQSKQERPLIYWARAAFPVTNR
jgi:hypothetical protein